MKEIYKYDELNKKLYKYLLLTIIIIGLLIITINNDK